VDGFNFLKDYGSRDSLQQRGESLGDEDERTVVDLLIEQIEFCDVIVLNKTDLISAAERERLKHILHRLNPRASMCRKARNTASPVSSIAAAGRFILSVSFKSCNGNGRASSVPRDFSGWAAGRRWQPHGRRREAFAGMALPACGGR